MAWVRGKNVFYFLTSFAVAKSLRDRTQDKRDMPEPDAYGGKHLNHELHFELRVRKNGEKKCWLWCVNLNSECICCTKFRACQLPTFIGLSPSGMQINSTVNRFRANNTFCSFRFCPDAPCAHVNDCSARSEHINQCNRRIDFRWDSQLFDFIWCCAVSHSLFVPRGHRCSDPQ